MGASKKARRGHRGYYRAPAAGRTTVTSIEPEQEEQAEPAETRAQADVQESNDTRPVAAVAPSPAQEDEAPAEPPTIILTPEQVALLGRARPPQVTLPSPDDEGYAYLPSDRNRTEDTPTIILDVAALLDAPPPPMEAPIPPPPLDDPFPPPARSFPRPLPDASFPRPDASDASGTPTRRRADLPAQGEASGMPTRKRAPQSGPLFDRDEELARLRRLRLEREAQGHAVAPESEQITSKLRQWWRDIRPGLDRVLGRSHRAGSRGARATTYQTSSQLPAVRMRPVTEGDIPAVSRLSAAARTIGERAQTAAGPALAKLHTRAEHMAQQIVDRIDERLGGRPPLQHVLLGPGRMIVSFAPNVTIRDAQIIIASVQARSLRRLVGYNAYLVLVPPGREARYAERLHAYRQVTGVHFGPQRPAAAALSNAQS